jgi:biopolymer transport protein ExbD/biopolymer transport protein TolR
MPFGRLERTSGPTPMSDINMTPLIDVMLVLLVIFMITAPLMTTALKLELPKADAAPANELPQSISIGLDAAGQLFVGDERATREQLQARVKAAAAANRDAEVQLRADQAVPYGKVAELIGLVQQAGLNRIAFVTEPQPPGR